MKVQREWYVFVFPQRAEQQQVGESYHGPIQLNVRRDFLIFKAIYLQMQGDERAVHPREESKTLLSANPKDSWHIYWTSVLSGGWVSNLYLAFSHSDFVRPLVIVRRNGFLSLESSCRKISGQILCYQTKTAIGATTEKWYCSDEKERRYFHHHCDAH